MTDLYLEHVPDGAREGKTGKNILFYGDCNVGNNLLRLSQMINKYTIHKSRVVMFKEFYLQYDQSEILYVHPLDTDPYKEYNLDEIKELFKQSDFLHIGRRAPAITNINIPAYITPKTALYQYWGSIARGQKLEVLKRVAKHGIPTINCEDYTCWAGIPNMYNMPKSFDSTWLEPVNHDVEMVKVAHAPTNRPLKDTDNFLKVMEKLSKSLPVKTVLLENMSYDKCMAARQECQIHFDQINEIGFYGGSALEAMSMQQVCLGSINQMTRMQYPSLPIVSVTRKNLEEELRKYIVSPDKRKIKGAAGGLFVKKFHDPMMLLKRFLAIYDTIWNGLRTVSEGFVEEEHLL